MTITHDNIAAWASDAADRKAAFAAILDRGTWRHTETLCRDNGWRHMNWTHPATREAVRAEVGSLDSEIRRLTEIKRNAETALRKLDNEIEQNGEW